MAIAKKKKKNRVKGRKYVSFGGWNDFVHSEQQNFNKIPTKLIYIDKLKELEDSIEEGQGQAVNIKGGDNITIKKGDNNSVTIGVKLEKNHEEHYSSGSYVIKSGSNLDEIVEILIKSVNENADAIDGEKINI